MKPVTDKLKKETGYADGIIAYKIHCKVCDMTAVSIWKVVSHPYFTTRRVMRFPMYLGQKRWI
jgi:hypothetical protein